MIHGIFSSLPSFKSLEFRPGLNVLIARKEEGATSKQTRNRAGKSSLIEIIHLLTGADVDKDSDFRSKELIDHAFGMTFDVGGEKVTIERSGKPRSKLRVDGGPTVLGLGLQPSYEDWKRFLGEEMFKLQNVVEGQGPKPTFRSLFAYFVRREASQAFVTPEQQAAKQQKADYQVAVLYLLGLEWSIASEWQSVRDTENVLKKFKAEVIKGSFDRIIGKAADLRTEIAVAEHTLEQQRRNLDEFHVLPQYSEIEFEADELTKRINELSNANIIDGGQIRDLEEAVNSEAPPPIHELEGIYMEAGISLPELALKRYDEVSLFHESVIRNRRDYLLGELENARQRIVDRDAEKKRLDQRRAQVMSLLKNHGALDEFSKLQGEAARRESEVESLRQRFDAAERLESDKTKLQIDRKNLTLRLRRDFAERRDLLTDAIVTFEKISSRLYESAGRMTIDVTSNGPEFRFPMQGSSSKGISNMQIFCFDMMLMSICAQRGIGPGFLVHDSHLFDGVDGRQVVEALKVGAEISEELGFQYIVTMNEDDAYKETTAGFDLRNHVLPVTLTDAKDDGGLYGIRLSSPNREITSGQH